MRAGLHGASGSPQASEGSAISRSVLRPPARARAHRRSRLPGASSSSLLVATAHQDPGLQQSALTAYTALGDHVYTADAKLNLCSRAPCTTSHPKGYTSAVGVGQRCFQKSQEMKEPLLVCASGELFLEEVASTQGL